MALPKISAPTFEITLPVSKKSIQFRPFLVKEQKILLMAMESGEKGVIESNVKHILNNCLISDIDIDSLPIVDIEYYFLNIRARSVGEVVESKYKCENEVDGVVCNNTMDTKFNILDVQVDMPKDLNDKIQITPTVGVKLRYPNFDLVDKLQDLDNATDIAFELIIECIEYVYDEDNLYYAHETPREELMAFLESLTKDQFEKIEEFVENLPKLKKEIEVTCKKCGFSHKIKVEGLESFF